MTIVRKPIVVVGSINIDLVAHAENIPHSGETVLGSDFQIHPGGKGANQAVAVARLGYPVQLVGQLGSDIFGEQLRKHLGSSGVDISAVDRTEGSSGVALIAVAARGENSILVVPGVNLLVSPVFLDKHADTICNAGVVLTQLEIPLETVMHLAEMCAEANVPLLLDPAPACNLPESLLAHLAWFTPNETEASFYTSRDSSQPSALEPSAIAHSLLAKGIGGVILKLGSRGAYVATGTGEAQIQPFSVHAVDTTAAGDAFNGAFATGLMLGKTPLESARFASAAAAISVTRAGAQPSMPAMPEVEQLLEMLLIRS